MTFIVVVDRMRGLDRIESEFRADVYRFSVCLRSALSVSVSLPPSLSLPISVLRFFLIVITSFNVVLSGSISVVRSPPPRIPCPDLSTLSLFLSHVHIHIHIHIHFNVHVHAQRTVSSPYTDIRLDGSSGGDG